MAEPAKKESWKLRTTFANVCQVSFNKCWVLNKLLPLVREALFLYSDQNKRCPLTSTTTWLTKIIYHL